MGNCCGGSKKEMDAIVAPVKEILEDIASPKPVAAPPKPKPKPPRDVEAPPPPVELADDDADVPLDGPKDPTQNNKKPPAKNLRPRPVITVRPGVRLPDLERPTNLTEFAKRHRNHAKPKVYDPYGDSTSVPAAPTKPTTSIFTGAAPAAAPAAPVAQTVDFSVLTPPLPIAFLNAPKGLVSNPGNAGTWGPMAGSVGLTTRPLSAFAAIVTDVPASRGRSSSKSGGRSPSSSKPRGSSSRSRRGSRSRHSRSGSLTLAIPQASRSKVIRKKPTSPSSVRSSAAVTAVTTLIGDTSALVASTPGLNTYTAQNNVIGADADWEDVKFSPFATSEASLTAAHMARRGEAHKLMARKQGRLANGVPENVALDGVLMVRSDARTAAARYSAPKAGKMIVRQVKRASTSTPSTAAKARSFQPRSPAVHVTSAVKIVDSQGLVVVSGPDAVPATAQGPTAVVALPEKMEETPMVAVNHGSILRGIGDASAADAKKGGKTGLRRVDKENRGIAVRAGSTAGKVRAAKAKAKAPGTSLVAARRRSVTKSKAAVATQAKPAGGTRVKTSTSGGYIAVLKTASSPKSPSTSPSKSSPSSKSSTKNKDGAFKAGTFRTARIASPVIRLG